MEVVQPSLSFPSPLVSSLQLRAQTRLVRMFGFAWRGKDHLHRIYVFGNCPECCWSEHGSWSEDLWPRRMTYRPGGGCGGRGASRRWFPPPECMTLSVWEKNDCIGGWV